jgi:hypothetical protein
MIVVLAINLSRPADYYMFAAVDISIISTMYIVFRSRFAIQATLASTFTIADLSIILLTKDLTDQLCAPLSQVIYWLIVWNDSTVMLNIPDAMNFCPASRKPQPSRKNSA